MSGLRGETLSFQLPVSLSKEAQRKVLLATGVKPEPRQIFWIENLLKVEDPQLRERLVDLADKIEVRTYGPGENLPDFQEATEVTTLLYHVLAFHRSLDKRGGWGVWSDEGHTIELSHVWLPGEGRTRTVLGAMAERHDRDEVWALAAGHPLVKEMAGTELTLSEVLDAYERAVELADEICRIAYAEHRGLGERLWMHGIGFDDEMILLSHRREPVDPIGFRRESDPETFAKALTLVNEMAELPILEAEYFVYRSCSFAESAIMGPWDPPTDAEIFQKCLVPSAEGARLQDLGNRTEREAKEAYETERERWISEHGSNRLKLAAQRGYRHDGLYRDERLAAELPGFIGFIGQRSEAKEVINPSEEALKLETETQQRVSELGLDVLVRLVFVKADVELAMDGKMADGEYVEVSNYLGRHKVYRPVAPVIASFDPDDDIPF